MKNLIAVIAVVSIIVCLALPQLATTQAVHSPGYGTPSHSVFGTLIEVKLNYPGQGDIYVKLVRGVDVIEKIFEDPQGKWFGPLQSCLGKETTIWFHFEGGWGVIDKVQCYPCTVGLR